MTEDVRDFRSLRARCADLEKVIERNARALGRSEDYAARVAKVRGSDRAIEDLDLWDLIERRAQLAGLAQRLLEAQAILHHDESLPGEMLQSLLEEPELVQLGNRRRVACYPITLPVAVNISQRQDILRQCVAARMAAEGTENGHLYRHRLEGIRTWQRAAIMYEVTLPPGSTFRLPIDPPTWARGVASAAAWLDGSNRWDRQFWRTWGLVCLIWRLLDRLVPGRWLSRITGIPAWWCWTVTVPDEVAIVSAHLKANDERARRLPRLTHHGEVKGTDWSGFSSAMADARRKFPREFVHDTSMLAMLTDWAITAKRKQAERQEHERARKQKPAAKGAGNRTPRAKAGRA